MQASQGMMMMMMIVTMEKRLVFDF